MESRTQVKGLAGWGRATEMGVNEPREGVDTPVFRRGGRKLAEFLIPASILSLRSQPILDSYLDLPR